ncbi:MAG: PorP/SprF family type IX secretion system membrane protein [Cyclobacteriaceae bacterium]|nr:PorP/SprF family type IX secretion system membrane protein [Cyclobacteriaceae bacterium]
MHLKFRILLIALVCTSLSGYSQDAPVFSQFLQNPFQFNSAYAANQGYAEINAFYRKQWLGIENAPTIGAFNIQTPLGRNVATGLTLVSNKTILLNASSAAATFAYRVRMGPYHNLNFGLSGGIGFNTFNMEAVANANDPALANIIPKSQYLTGQFGVHYRFRNFNMGFALPNLFDTKPNALSEFQKVELNPFRNKFASIGYSFMLADLQLTPTVLYRALDNQQTQWEGLLLVTYKGFLWAGASYRDGYGLTGLIGVRLKNNYKLGYAYEHPTSSLKNASSGSHEIYFGMRVGKRDREAEYALDKKKADSLQQVADARKAAEKEKADQEKEKADQEKENVLKAKQQQEQLAKAEAEKLAQQQPQKTEPAEKKPEPETKTVTPLEEPTLPADYYIVLGAYKIQANALKHMRDLRDKGYMPEMIYNLASNAYYVYLVKTDNRQNALDELIKERERNRYPGVWIYKVSKPK